MRTFGIAPILFLALILRILLVIINLDFLTLPAAGADAVTFERVAWEIANDQTIGKSNFLFNSYFISLLGSFVYSIVGRAPYFLHLIMALLGTAIVFVSYQTSLVIWQNKRIALRTAWFIALFPQLLLHSAIFLRETPVALCIALCGLFAARYYRSPSPKYILPFLLWAMLGTLFHTGVIIVIPAFVAAIFIWPPSEQVKSKTQTRFAALATVIILGFGLAFVQSTGIGLGKFGGSLSTTIETLELNESRDPAGGSAFPSWVRMEATVSELWKVPIRMGVFLTSPAIPFLVRTPGHLIGLLDAAFYLLMGAAVITGYKSFKRQPVVMALLFMIVALTLVYSFGVSNFGTAIRHRAKFVPLLLMISAASPMFNRRPMPREEATIIIPSKRELPHHKG